MDRAKAPSAVASAPRGHPLSPLYPKPEGMGFTGHLDKRTDQDRVLISSQFTMAQVQKT